MQPREKARPLREETGPPPRPRPLHAVAPEDEERETEELVRRLRPLPPRWRPPAA